MALNLSVRTLRALQELEIEPNLVAKFEGYPVLFSVRPVKEFITIGCPGFFIGEPGFFIGGLKDLQPELNKQLIDSGATTWTIRQQINYDEGKSSSISSMNLVFVDKDQEISRLMSPGQELEEILGRKVQVFATYGEVSFFEDSIEVFKGFVTTIESGPGSIKFKINAPDTKKKVELFQTVETALTNNINSSQTSLVLDDASTFIEPGGKMRSYVRINSELIEYTTVSGNTLGGLTRGAQGTTAAGHLVEDQVSSVYSLEGNPLDLALELMMSGHGSDPVHTDIDVASFEKIGPGIVEIPNAIFFSRINVVRDFGIQVGDTVTTTGANNPLNNGTGPVTEIVQVQDGYYIVVGGVNFVPEEDSPAVMSIFTQYNTLPVGMKMTPDEVDIAEHIKIRDLFHSSVEMRIFLKEDKIEGKKFIEEELYRPIACYELPRKAKASVGFTVGPIPGEEIKTLDATNVKKPQNMRITRGSSRAFFNEVVYRYDDTPFDSSVKFTRGRITISETSKNRIKAVDRTFTISSLGLRTNLNAENIAASNSARLLDRYKFAAELVTCKTLLRDTAGVEVGDIIVGDFKELQVTDITQGNRDFKPRLFEIQNKTLNLKTGDVDLTLLDTGLNIDTRFGLMSPCSPIAGVISPSQFVVGPDPNYPSRYGDDEFRKWTSIVSVVAPASISIHNEDYSIREDLVLTGIDENTFTLQSPATITLTPGLMVDFTGYVDSDTSDKQKLVYAYMTDDAAFPDGGFPYAYI